MGLVLAFESLVDTAGYRWIPDLRDSLSRYAQWLSKDDPKLALVRKGGTNEAEYRSVYPIVEDPALYRNFARRVPTLEGILEFAEQYGNLRNSVTSFVEWKFEMCTMHFLIEIWDAALTGQVKALTKIFPKSSDKKPVTFAYPYGRTILSYEGHTVFQTNVRVPSRARRAADSGFIEAETVIDAALQYIMAAVGVRITASQPFVGLMDDPKRADLWPQNIRLSIVPSDLRSALWFQFAEAICEQKQYRQCEVCRRYMELSPDVNRADRRYCSDACRSKALRRRQKIAIEMRHAGKSLREISIATGSDTKTIKQWLDKKGS